MDHEQIKYHKFVFKSWKYFPNSVFFFFFLFRHIINFLRVLARPASKQQSYPALAEGQAYKTGGAWLPVETTCQWLQDMVVPDYIQCTEEWCAGTCG